MRSVFRNVGVSAATYAACNVLADNHCALPFLLAALTMAIGMTVFVTVVKPILTEHSGMKEAPLAERDA